MSSPDYKGPSRAETARRVRERSEGVNPSRGLDEALDDRIEREDAEAYSRVTEALWPYWQQQTSMPAEAAVAKLLAERDRYRSLLEEARDYLTHQSWRCDHPPHYYFAEGSEREREGCPCGLDELEARLSEALKVPDPSSGGNQGRGPDSSPTERGSNKDGA